MLVSGSHTNQMPWPLPSATSPGSTHTLSPRSRKSGHSKGKVKGPYLSSSSIEDSIDKGHDGCFQIHFIPVPAQTSVQLIQQCLDEKAGQKRRGALRILQVQPLHLCSCHSNYPACPSGSPYPIFPTYLGSSLKLTFSKKHPLPPNTSVSVLPYFLSTQPSGLGLFCGAALKPCFSTL